MNEDKILDRVRKLLRLSKSTNANEAASAAAEASRLMQEYQIEEMSVNLDDTSAANESVGTESIHQEGRKASHWKGGIAAALARSLGAKMYWSKDYDRETKQHVTRTNVIGRPSDVRTIGYMHGYLVNEIDRLADEAWEAEKDENMRYQISDTCGEKISAARLWREAFKKGASTTISNRLDAQRATTQAEFLAKAKEEQRKADELKQLTGGLATQAQCTALIPTATALERIKKVEEDVKRIAKSKGLRATRSSGGRGSADGYAAGVEAGRGVSLGGGGRQIGASKKQIGGGS